MYCFNCMKEAKPGEICRHCRKQNVPKRVPHHLAPGTTLCGKYVVGNAIGEGGFGITYVGIESNLNMRVAIKEFFPSGKVNRNSEASNDVYTTTESQKKSFEAGKERFLLEARSLAQLSEQPGVVRVMAYFEENGTAYIVMNYLEGNTLAKCVERNGVFAPEKIFRLMLPVMSALKKIHDSELIHRDISPDNIIYKTDGTLVLTDFGSARYFSNRDDAMSIMLKRGYAPEEQYRENGNQGPWTDVYGLCATIYYCITGITPVDGLDRAHGDMLKLPSELGINISPALESVLLTGMAVNSGDRYQSMDQLSQMTQKALRNETLSADSIIGSSVKRDYNSGLNRRGDYIDVNPPRYEPSREIQNRPPEPKRGNAAVIAASVAASVAVLLIAAIIIFFVLNNGGDNSDKKTEPTTVAAETQKPENTLAERATVPDLSGKSKEEAIKLLKAEGLGYVIEAVETYKQELENRVSNQSPQADSMLEQGDTVTIYIYQYKEPETEESQSKTYWYCKASDYATLRQTPSRSGAELARVQSREAVEYLGEEGEFYKVVYNGQTGYILNVCLSPDINAPLYYGNGNSSSSTVQNTDYYYCRASEYVTMRTRPTSLNGKYVITKINQDEKVEVLDTVYGDVISEGGSTFDDSSRQFYKIRYNGKTGYAIAKFFSTDPDSPVVTDEW